jgi:hypothetical protein
VFVPDKTFQPSQMFPHKAGAFRAKSSATKKKSFITSTTGPSVRPLAAAESGNGPASVRRRRSGTGSSSATATPSKRRSVRRPPVLSGPNGASGPPGPNIIKPFYFVIYKCS